MQHEVWARLTSPFPSEALTWIVAEIDADGARARLEPAWAPEAVRARLDSHLGVEGWSYALGAAGAAGVVCTLTIGGTTRSAAASFSSFSTHEPRPALESISELAFARCARQFGLGPVVALKHETYWVEFNPDAAEALYDPEPVPLDEGELGAPASAVDVAGTQRAPSGGPAAGVPVESLAGTRSASGEALAMIERLLDRLKTEGLGKEAARLVAAHHGGTPEDARELYRRLRELLKQEVSA